MHIIYRTYKQRGGMEKLSTVGNAWQEEEETKNNNKNSNNKQENLTALE